VVGSDNVEELAVVRLATNVGGSHESPEVITIVN
jgi:hypothetical protein